jgi:UDP-glucose 4-epimerase
MRILLTGGAGYVGSACLRWLLRHRHDVLAYDNLSEGNPTAVPRDRLQYSDILDTPRLTRTMIEQGTEAVIHLAGVVSGAESVRSPQLHYHANLLGTKSVLDAMRAAGVSKIIFSSSATIYARGADGPLTEDAPQLPETPHGSSKLAAEWLIRDYGRAYDIGYTILRYFNAAGADSDGRHGEARRRETQLIPFILDVALGRRREVLIPGGDYPTPDGTYIRDYLHVEDVAEAHRLAVEAVWPGTAEVYNLGLGTGTSLRQVVQACEDCVGMPIAVRVVERRPGEPALLLADSGKIRDRLGWQPRFRDIGTIVRTAWAWQSAHPAGYTAPAHGMESMSVFRC